MLWVQYFFRSDARIFLKSAYFFDVSQIAVEKSTVIKSACFALLALWSLLITQQEVYVICDTRAIFQNGNPTTHSVAISQKLFGSTNRTFFTTRQQKISHLATDFYTQTREGDQDNWLYFLKYLFYEVYNFQIMSFSVTLQYELYPNMEHHCQYWQSLYQKNIIEI